MHGNIKHLIKRIRFYVILLGGFLGIEIPLFIFTYFKFFSRYRNLIWIFTFILGIGSSLIVFYMINGILNDDYETKLLFDNMKYDSDTRENDHEKT